MLDREKVIKELVYLPTTVYEGFYQLRITHDLRDKVVKLLKEQEAVVPNVSSTEQRCGNCNKIIEMDGWITCPWCGKSIAWNEWWNKNGGQAAKWE